MKTKKSMLVLVAIMTIIFGVVTFLGGMSVLGWDFTALDTEVLTAAELSFGNKSIQRLEIDSDGWNFEIIKSDENKIEYYNSDRSKIKVVIEGDKLKFDEDRNFASHFLIASFNGLKRNQVTVKIYLNQPVELDAEGSSINIFSDGFDYTNIHLDGSSAKLNIKNFNANNIDAEGSSVKLNLEHGNAKKIEVDGSSANLTASDLTFTSLKADGSSVKAFLSNTVGNSIVISGSSAKLDLQNSVADSVLLDGSSVRLTGNGIDVNKIRLSGSSADAVISLVGSLEDYASITVSGSSAKLYIKDVKSSNYIGSGTKTITADGSSVKVKIMFSQS